MSVASRIRSAFRPYLGDLQREVDQEMMTFRETRGHAAATRRVLIVVATAAFCLLFIRFMGAEDDVPRLLKVVRALGLHETANDLGFALQKSPDRKINMRIFWCISRVFSYGVVPALVIKLVLRESLASFGLSLRGAGKHAHIYLMLFAIVLPALIMASYAPGFQAKYPYYRFATGEALWPNLLYWELLYGSQFFALELFFRGLFVHGLRPAFGYASVLVPIVPYVMIHFGKPLPEAIGSAITGFVLGTLSLRTRSVVGGACIHVSVACSMDLLSLWHRGFF